jgi:hypothetical protein
MDPKAFACALLVLPLLGCQQPKPHSAQAVESNCNPMLISCAELTTNESGFYMQPVGVHKEDLEYRIAELRRWLKWQREIQLGLADEPFGTSLEMLGVSWKEDLELNLSLSPEDRQLLLQSWGEPLLAQE